MLAPAGFPPVILSDCGASLNYATALLATAGGAAFVLFLLPGGRPRRLAVISDSQAGGRPRRRTRPRAKRSRLRIASSIWARSSFNSVRIFETSISLVPRLALLAVKTKPWSRTNFLLDYTLDPMRIEK